MPAIRRATVSWKGELLSGKGTVSADSSGAFSSLPITWGSRTESPDGRTSPEELIAAAHASCYSMAFSSDLTKAGAPPESVDVTCEIAFDRIDGRWTVASSTLTVHACVPGISAERFHEIAVGAKDNCPVSRALKGNVALTVHAYLESSVAAG
jgi:osmotically inducible protein OsmC